MKTKTLFIRQSKSTIAIAIFFFLSKPAVSASIEVGEHTWVKLSELQKNSIQSGSSIKLYPLHTYGVLVNTQTINSSTNGSSLGSNLGYAVGSATYADNNWSNYSAKEHLGASILGSIIGGALMDKSKEISFQTRYFVEFHDGTNRTINQSNKNQFTLPTGACISINSLKAIPKFICNETKKNFLYRAGHTVNRTIKPSPEKIKEDHKDSSGEIRIKCKLPGVPPVMASVKECLDLGGSYEN